MFKQFAAAAIAVTISTGALAADQFKSTQLLAQSTDNQIGYIDASLAMASVMVKSTQNHCITNWAQQNRPTGYSKLRSAMTQYGDYHPAAVIAAVLEKECGSFDLANH